MATTDSSEPQELLRLLAEGDERVLRQVLAPTPEVQAGGAATGPAIERRIGALVRLAALLSVGACTTTLRWAVELAATAGADEEALVAVLVAAGAASGAAQVVASAPQLALAMGLEIESEGWTCLECARLPAQETSV